MSYGHPFSTDRSRAETAEDPVDLRLAPTGAENAGCPVDIRSAPTGAERRTNPFESEPEVRCMKKAGQSVLLFHTI